MKASAAIHTDDTPITLLNPRRTAHAWVYVGDAANPYTVFDLTPGHHQEFPQRFLAGYYGYIHADGYVGYNPLYAAGTTHIGCWMHVRRNFFEASAMLSRVAAPDMYLTRTTPRPQPIANLLRVARNLSPMACPALRGDLSPRYFSAHMVPHQGHGLV